MGDGVHINLTRFSAELKGTDKKFASAMRKRVREAFLVAGSGMVRKVQQNADWSSRIPGAVKLQTTFSAKNAKVKILVDHNKAPHARPIELGNGNGFNADEVARRASSLSGTRNSTRRRAMASLRSEGVGVTRLLRHPVFDSKHPATRWSAMPTRPFFFPAATEEAKESEAAMDSALDLIARDAGFH